MSKEGKVKKSLRLDIIVVALLLALALLWLVITFLTREEGNVVSVEIDGILVAEYSLSVDGEYVLGDGGNVLVISGGEAYMASADCPDKTCVGVGRIRYAGQSIVCLPNRVVVTVLGDGDGDLDLVS